MEKKALIDRLTEMPGEILIKETCVFAAQNELNAAKEALTAKEDQLLLSGAIDGKNSEARAAQLREQTIEERNQVVLAEGQLAFARIEFNKAVNEFKSLRVVASLICGEVA